MGHGPLTSCGFPVKALLVLLRVYQWVISPVLAALGARCRFYPTCSQYAMDALRLYGPARGMLKTVKRLAKCHPWHPGGFDPA
ncbi:MAG: membrane protein insertion efficiency factor YidD [Desulfarculales bacterium]|jgi:putative membrane protein insertion efficiency factor|nr:membrane protein insertion efficiency factor YidD [Desulfarculales bacterium]